MNSAQDQRTKRWFSQRWIFDLAISTAGIEPFTGGSLTRGYEAIGTDASGISREIASRTKKFADITRECKRIAERRETFAKEAESEGHKITARDNFFIASIMYGCARWPIWDDLDADLIGLTEKIKECYLRYSALSDHGVESVEISFEGKTLYAYLHMPRIQGKQTPPPCVVVIPGMDTFKEEQVRLYGDKFLERGFAVLAVDGPGQGESLARGMKLTADNFDRAGRAIMERAQGLQVNTRKIGIFAASFGSYWGPRIMAHDQRYVAGVFSNICHEPRMKTIFNGTLPSFKARHMWMTGIYDEDEFDEGYCSKLTLEGVGKKIDGQSIFIAAGSDDPLSPIEFTYDFFKSIASPKKKLFVYEGEEHRISDPMLPARIGDFMDDAFNNRDAKSGGYFLERGTAWRNPKPLDFNSK